MRIDQLLRTLTAKKWALEPETLTTLASILQRKTAGESFLGFKLHAELGIPMPEEQDALRMETRQVAATRSRGKPLELAVVPINGMIESRAGSLGASPRSINTAFTMALNSRSVDAIVLDVASPGGQVDGVPELANRIYEARKVKPIVAFSDDMIASAAYWLAAAAEEIWMLRSASGAGAIGVFSMHIDESAALEQEGIKIQALSAGKYKLEGVPWAPLDEEAAEFRQAEINETYEWFVKDVARFRGATQTSVRNGYGEGRLLRNQAAVDSGLIDKLGSFEDVVQRVSALVNRRTGKRTDTVRVRMEVA